MFYRQNGGPKHPKCSSITPFLGLTQILRIEILMFLQCMYDISELEFVVVVEVRGERKIDLIAGVEERRKKGFERGRIRD